MPQVTPDEAFSEVYRVFRLDQGDDPSTLPAPLAAGQSPARKKQRTSPTLHAAAAATSSIGGGFIPDDADAGPSSGGFIPDDDEQQPIGGGFIADTEDSNVQNHEQLGQEGHETAAYIPLAEVPHALDILSLPTDDEDILAVFRSAAIDEPGESAGDRRRNRGPGAGPRPKFIGRSDFKEVCEVLLMSGDQRDVPNKASSKASKSRPPGETARGGRPSRLAAAKQRRAAQEQVTQDEGESELTSDGEEAYQASDDEAADEDEQEEGEDYGRMRRRRPGQANQRSSRKSQAENSEAASTTSTPSKSRRGGARKSQSTVAADSDDEDEEDQAGVVGMSGEQRETAQAAWSLFAEKLEEVYPDWGGERIGKKELHRLAISTGQKISDKEVSVPPCRRSVNPA